MYVCVLLLLDFLSAFRSHTLFDLRKDSNRKDARESSFGSPRQGFLCRSDWKKVFIMLFLELSIFSWGFSSPSLSLSLAQPLPPLILFT